MSEFDLGLLKDTTVTRASADSQSVVVVALSGTANAGKSVTAEKIIARLVDSGVRSQDIAMIMNEVGGSDDYYATISSVIELVVMPSGCFTCGDGSVLNSKVNELESAGKKVVIVEGFGLISGDELDLALRLLRKPFSIVTVLDESMFERNLEIYGYDFVASQVRVATTGILLTKGSSEEDVSEVVQEFLRRNVQQGVPWARSMQPGFPIEWSQSLLEVQVPSAFSANAVVARIAMANSDGAHGSPMAGFVLKKGVSLGHVQNALQELVSSGNCRVKGAVSGTAFSVGWGESNWNCKDADPLLSYLIVYLKGVELDVVLAPLYELVLVAERLSRSYETLRVPGYSQEVVNLLEGFVRGYGGAVNSRVSRLSGGWVSVVTHPEDMQLAQQCARRVAHQEEWRSRVYLTCLEYWVLCVGSVKEHRGNIPPDFLNNHQLELGVSLAWWATEFWEDLSETQRTSIVSCKPALLAAEGVMSLKALRADDDFWRYWQALEYLRALTFGREHLNEGERALVAFAIERVYGLAPTSGEADLWRAKFA